MYHTLFQHYALMFLQELQFTGGKRCFCSYLALRDSGKRAARTVLTGMCYSVGSATRQGSSS
ncbi:hypothetical protein KW433_14780, partial [Enterobacter kobei]|nr:hypothetical protein [Enterobacter kobei]